ncbi:TATA-box binding protein [Mobilisporobacter senegalensis]|uniref:TATA-box binding protein n=1 Tax=Mobilisporobacter senegalensis TaxID=1329262 RepID=A0A3N1XG48_9FIRM|nr:YwmB family TATA-box binding protein [Mobilisporobacter senegalensis]ROR25689.1 TATA-box binding protein [Mobilisporobacter senegalensis]
MKRNHKFKMTLYIIAVLWVAFLAQVAVHFLIQDDGRIIEAFANTNSNVVESKVEVAADYGSRYLNHEDKEKLIRYLASSIGINTDYEIEQKKGSKSLEYKAEKKSRNGEVCIELISIEKETEHGTREIKHYILVNLGIYENSNSIIEYKEIIEDAMKELNVLDYQSIVRFNGVYNGRLTLDEKIQITNELFQNLEAKVISESREDDLFIVYGYTGLIKEYIETNGNKVNINVVITYNEQADKTNIYLASPILNEDY